MILVEQFPRLRSHWTRYGFAIVSVVLAALCFYSSTALSSPYLIPFIAAVALSTLFGLGPGFVACVSASVLTDYFFISPAGTFGSNRSTWIAVGAYACALLVTHFGEQLFRRKRAQSVLSSGKFGLKQARDLTNARDLTGRLDGEAHGELYGWALNPEQPAIPPKISFFVDGRIVGEALAVHYRPDVQEHSFFFDLSESSPAKSNARIDAKFWDGRPLPNSPLIANIPPRDTPRHPQAILFMHIAKTAGTAFREAIAENYKHSQIAYLYPHPPGLLVSSLGLLPLDQRARFRLVMGHFEYGIHELLPQESTYVTIVRDPIKRVISHYYYLLETQPDITLDGPSPMSLIEMLERRRTTDLDNLMVRCFSGVDEYTVPAGQIDQQMYDLAVEHLRTRFSFVGYQDRVDQAYSALQKQFNWKPVQSLPVVNPGAQSGSIVDEATRKAVEHFNRWDCRLYSEIRKLFP